MEEGDRVYLVASFPDTNGLKQAARALHLPENSLAVLGSEASSAEAAAKALGVTTELDESIFLADALRDRLQWHLEHHDRPLLAVNVMAAQGRDLRYRLQELGGRLIDEPTVSSQEGDVEWDPGMETDEPPLAHEDEISDRIDELDQER